MRKLVSSSLLPLDSEIEKTARRNKKKAKEARNQSSTMADQNDPPDPNAQRRLRVKEAYDRTSSKKVAGVYEVDPLTSFSTKMVSQFEALNKKLESFSMDRHQPIHPANQVQNVSIFCDMCGEGHPTQQCPLIYHDGAQSSTVNYVGNSSNQQNNPYSNTYNPGWRNHPNFSVNNNARPNMPYKPNAPPGFQQNQRPHEMEKKPTTEDLLLQYMQKTDALIQSQSASMRALEMQVGDDDVHMMTHHTMDALELSLQEVGKLKSRWSGPFKVVQVYPYGAIEFEDMHSGRTFKVNGQRLKPYLGGDIDRNVSSVTLSEL
ncbi:hypothetical protein POM88_027756 [Heracleum sosnowskyi]|uniref:Retrotransposon gag protein n=1 Tax=Heracleum sosnowskyi TaxID=360622 RepID=A0AAD8IAL3_9APIA|nr:hypothetical protein POM88_027756 [Heracleum sosnowskyi]